MVCYHIISKCSSLKVCNIKLVMTGVSSMLSDDDRTILPLLYIRRYFGRKARNAVLSLLYPHNARPKLGCGRTLDI